MKIIIHRGAREVGGSCVEITYEDTMILLDIGLILVLPWLIGLTGNMIKQS